MTRRLADLAAYQKQSAAQDLARLNSARRAMGWMIGITGMLAVMLVGSIGTLQARGLSGRIQLLTGVMRGLAGGDLASDIPCATDHDEIGRMARAVEVFKQSAIEAQRRPTSRRPRAPQGSGGMPQWHS